MSERIVFPKNHLFNNLTGQRYGRLVVLEYVGPADPKTKQSLWRLRCDCGNLYVARGNNLRRGKTLSCGCLNQQRRSEVHRTHGKSGTRLYNIWNNMRERCYNEKNRAYKWYGARGILVCDEWRGAGSFETFFDWAVTNGYADNLSIDRFPNRDGNYEPSNCRWATSLQQSENTDHCKLLTIFGETKSVKAWSLDPRALVSGQTLKRRMLRGWDVELAITTPPHNKGGGIRPGHSGWKGPLDNSPQREIATVENPHRS